MSGVATRDYERGIPKIWKIEVNTSTNQVFLILYSIDIRFNTSTIDCF